MIHLCSKGRVLLFVPYVNWLRLKIGHEKPKIIVHLCGCYPFDVGTIMKEMYGVSAHDGRLLYALLCLEQLL